MVRSTAPSSPCASLINPQDDTHGAGHERGRQGERRALEACPEDCWICREHDGVLSPCGFSDLPHKEHVCRVCSDLLGHIAPPPVTDPMLDAPNDNGAVPSATRGAALCVVRWCVARAISIDAINRDPELWHISRLLKRLTLSGGVTPDLIRAELRQVHTLGRLQDAAFDLVDNLLMNRAHQRHGAGSGPALSGSPSR